MKKIVISGINLFSGGPLSIIKDCLNYLKTRKDIEIIALVHDKKLFLEFSTCNNIKFLEFPDSRKSWLRRVYYEYFYFKGLSKKIKPDLWLSLHDMTPNVEAKIRAVYCHNPSPFYKMSKLEKKLDSKLRLFNLFYKYLYRINIKKNDFVIVQQNWLKEEFEKIFKISNVIVSYPNIDLKTIDYVKIEKQNKKISFFYPAFPRVFKNFEIICEAAESLEKKGINNLEIILTIEKGMNKYGDYIYEKYNHIKSIKFIGKLSREEVFSYYDYSDALIFPSKLETWGLPISEFKEFNKPIILSDLAYSKETIGNYELVNFFNPNSVSDLEKEVIKVINKNKMHGNIQEIEDVKVGWKELLEKII